MLDSYLSLISKMIKKKHAYYTTTILSTPRKKNAHTSREAISQAAFAPDRSIILNGSARFKVYFRKAGALGDFQRAARWIYRSSCTAPYVLAVYTLPSKYCAVVSFFYFFFPISFSRLRKKIGEWWNSCVWYGADQKIRIYNIGICAIKD